MFGRKKRIVAPFSELSPSLYVRVSTDEQGGANNVSLPDQEQAGRHLAAHYGMPVYDEYVLWEDESGTKLDERPQLTLLRQWIREKKINAIIVRSADRLSRRLRHGIELIDEMRANNVRFFVAQWNREFDLHNDADVEYLTEEFRFAEKWGKMLSQTMVWGKRGRVERGSAAVGGMDKYGYIKVRHADKSLVYERDEQEAPIIQKISNLHVTERLSLRELARRLKGTPTPKESRGRVKPEKMNVAKKKAYGEWNYATIYAILRDPTYYQGYIEYYVTSDQYEPVNVPIPPLITKEAFEESQRLLNDGRRMSVRNTKNEHLCARILYCSCGSTMQVKYKTSRKDAYICGRTKYKGDYSHASCDAPIKSVVTELVDTKVWEWIIDITEHPHTIRKYLENAKETLEKHNAPILARIAQIEESRRRIDRKVDSVIEMAITQKDEARAQGNRKGVDEANAMLQRFRTQLEKDLAELREEEDTLRSQLLSEVINEKFIGQWDKYASRIGDKIAEFDFKKRRDTLEALHFKGTLGIDNGERVVWVYLFESFADTVYLDHDVGGNSVDNLPPLITGDEPGRHY